MPHLDTGNTGFMLLCSSLVMLMTPGLAFFYGGLVGRKNVLAIMIQSFVSLCWTTVIWFVCGYSLCFSGDVGGVIGNLDMAFLRGVNLMAPSSADVGSSSFGLGDILVTPISLYGESAAWDYQLQFTVWSSSGHFSPGGASNRGSGYSSLVYSVGGVAYPGAKRNDWSLSAVARIEQNFEQKDTGIHPGDDIVVDWGIGKVIPVGSRSAEIGISGFGTWQNTGQDGGGDPGPYRYFGLGPEGSMPIGGGVTLRLRLHWEFAARNAVQGNNAWLIANFRR